MSKPLNPLLEPENRTRLMSNGIRKIDTLQRKMIDDAKKLISQTEIEQFKKTFERYQANIKPMVAQLNRTAEQNRKLFQLDANTKKTIADAVKVSNEIEGYKTVITKQMQEEVQKLMKDKNVVVNPKKKDN